METKSSVVENIIGAVEDTFKKSAYQEFKEYYLKNLTEYEKWLIFSDYCIGDNNKEEDVVTYTIMPYFYDFEDLKKIISHLSPKDLKKIKKLNNNFADFIKHIPIMNMSFMLGKERFLTDPKDHNEYKDHLKQMVKETTKMMERWCVNTPEHKERYLQQIKKQNILLSDLNRKSFNSGLLTDIMIVSLLAAHIGNILAQEANAKLIGWFSDRDKMLDFHDKIIHEYFLMNFHGLTERDGIETSDIEIALGIPEGTGRMWYDELNRIPDYIAGTLSDWNIEKNETTNDKFVQVIKEMIADNKKNQIFRLAIDRGDISCARMIVQKN